MCKILHRWMTIRLHSTSVKRAHLCCMDGGAPTKDAVELMPDCFSAVCGKVMEGPGFHKICQFQAIVLVIYY